MKAGKEQIKAGFKRRETQHSNLRRATWHDYSSTGLYMLTIVTKDRQRIFGKLVTRPIAHISLSPLGQDIATSQISKIHTVCPNVEVWKTCIMPDHIHLIVKVNGVFLPHKTLGDVVRGFKAGCTKAAREMGHHGKGSIFQHGYHDRLIFGDRPLEKWQRYLDDNPRRLAIKSENPSLFTVIHNLEIGGKRMAAIGNRFLLDIPDKVAVVVHRSDSEEEYTQKCESWLRVGECGGVLVSAAIAPREKAVMRMAMDRGYRIILLRDNGLPPNYKPGGEAFDACAGGHLLQIAPIEYLPGKDKITRRECMELNALAESIAEGE